MEFIYILSVNITLSSLLLALIRAKLPKLWLRYLFVIICGLIFWIPIKDVPLIYYFYGYIGQLSLATILLVLSSLCYSLFNHSLMNRNSRLWLLGIIAFMGIFLYPLALGLGPMDPYRWGWQGYTLIVLLLGVALFCWFWSVYVVVLWVALSLLGNAFNLFESSNLWDYLIDPSVVIYALCSIGGVFIRYSRTHWALRS